MMNIGPLRLALGLAPAASFATLWFLPTRATAQDSEAAPSVSFPEATEAPSEQDTAQVPEAAEEAPALESQTEGTDEVEQPDKRRSEDGRPHDEATSSEEVHSSGPDEVLQTGEPNEPEFLEAPPEPEKVRRLSLTMSPLHLLFPILEVMGELQVAQGLGVAAIVGGGSMAAELTDGTTSRFRVFELGGQVAWYPLSAFDSLQVGAEVMYVAVSGDVDDIRGFGDGLVVGPFVGYKWIASSGFTLLVQGGFQYAAIRAEAQSASGTTAANRESTILPLLNFNLGWSF